MSAPARLALVGAGLVGQRHIAAIAAAEGAVLAAVIDPDAAAPSPAGVARLADLEELPEGAADGVILATPNGLHVAQGLACIARGLPVLVEKPIADSVAEARRLVEAGEAAGVPVLTGHHRRHNPLIAAARAMLDDGAIGRPVAAHGMFWLSKPESYFAAAWRRGPGAGPVFINLIHDIDVMRHLLGEVVAVQAAETAAVRGHGVEDACVLLMEFDSGLLATMSVADCIPSPWSWELSAAENPAYPPAGQACYVIGGTTGALELPGLRLWRHEGGGGWWSPLSATVAPRGQGDPLVRQVEHFARVIAGAEAPLVSGREGLRTLAVVEAVKAAARSAARTPVAA